jgi:hypothetical protein
MLTEFYNMLCTGLMKGCQFPSVWSKVTSIVGSWWGPAAAPPPPPKLIPLPPLGGIAHLWNHCCIRFLRKKLLICGTWNQNITRKIMYIHVCWNLGFHTTGYEEFYLLGYNMVYSDERQPTFRRNRSPPSSSNMEPGEWSREQGY